jgi:hypothetical protein
VQISIISNNLMIENLYNETHRYMYHTYFHLILVYPFLKSGFAIVVQSRANFSSRSAFREGYWPQHLLMQQGTVRGVPCKRGGSLHTNVNSTENDI